MSATVSTPTQQRWLTRLLSGQPHQVIEVHDRPYLLRWFLIPPNRFCNLYWHRFIGSDDPTPHCHPWNFVSIILSGSYFEETPGAQTRRRRAGQIAFRRATQIHRVTLPTAEDGTEKPCTSVVITGPWLRPWGFWCDGERFIPWQDFGPGGCGDQTPHEITAQKGHGNDA
ncbi:hypothetical protein [Mycobacterium avium]|uniref:hypothetical protein n=1 Tax=Mycobacterium avium TaxID=1764 RepID=UPI0009FC3744|nr:hypothetical protein [Mycobacterium avium]